MKGKDKVKRDKMHYKTGFYLKFSKPLHIFIDILAIHNTGIVSVHNIVDIVLLNDPFQVFWGHHVGSFLDDLWRRKRRERKKNASEEVRRNKP
tara:strand:- start:235 stop:513 length:279 start_codon:yes stop_codon:yes gene_type:complete